MQKRVAQILAVLEETYPQVKTQLVHENAFELLIATILSAQCTDRQVNMVTPGLFARFSTPEELVAADLGELEGLIRSTGFFHAKARSIKRCCEKLLSDFNGTVPRTMDELLSLPGVGRKTANVVLNAAFGVPGVVVDTHVKRISKRLGLTRSTDPERIEYDLIKVLPEDSWIGFSLQLIYLGRELCTARSPKCLRCPLLSLCPQGKKEASRQG
ncbi:MAG: endonuclease III [Thermodesulfobacteriota bacterium]